MMIGDAGQAIHGECGVSDDGATRVRRDGVRMLV
jgi:hypothetical protein